MYTKQDLIQEIDSLIAAGQRAANWITLDICRSHSADDFEQLSTHATLCQYHHTRDVVGKRLAKFVDDPSHPQVEMAGEQFDLLQAHYVVARDGDEVAIRIADLTDEELGAIADRLQKEGEAKISHALEVRAYILARRHAA